MIVRPGDRDRRLAGGTSPISHSVNIMVMGRGGYRFVDCLTLSVPLTAVAVFLPIIWPFKAPRQTRQFDDAASLFAD
jgi:hypothetical protein